MVEPQCTCPTWPGTSNRIVTAAPNPLCPVHGNATNVATEPEKFKTRSKLEDHLFKVHARTILAPRKYLKLWTIDELVMAHEKGHDPIPVPPSAIAGRAGLLRSSQEVSCTCAWTESTKHGTEPWIVDPFCPFHGDARDTHPTCTCLHTESGVMFVNSLCPLHGDVRDTSMYKQLECLLCGKPLDGNNILSHAQVHAACADAENAAADTGFVIDSKDDYITAIEDAIEELDDE